MLNVTSLFPNRTPLLICQYCYIKHGNVLGMPFLKQEAVDGSPVFFPPQK